jgi:hypothetical protein
METDKKDLLATGDLKENYAKIGEKKEEKDKKVKVNFPYKLAQSNK